MRTIVRREPFDVPITTMSRLMSDLFGESLAGTNSVDEGTLALDVSEDDSDVIVRASLPGFARDEVEVQVHAGVLTIKAEQTVESETKDERFYRRERRTGSLSRRVALPSNVQDDQATAELRDGVLTLRLPKVQKETPKKITIG
jgi:HSP20 family protein